MARQATAEATEAKTLKGKQLQATVSPDVYEAFVSYHWEAKKETVDLVRDALHDFGVKNGFLTVSEDGTVVPTTKA